MTRKTVLGLVVLLAFVLACILISVPGKGQEEKSNPTSQRRPFDENRFPIADYSAAESTDPAQRAKRQARGKKYDKSSWRVHPNSVSNSMVRVESVDRNLPAFPFDESSVVLVGQVSDAHAYLSNDKTGVYSVFTVQVNEILKSSNNLALSDGSGERGYPRKLRLDNVLPAKASRRSGDSFPERGDSRYLPSC